MRKTLIFIRIWFVLITSIAGIAVIVGRAQPSSEHVSQLHLTHCVLPCWIGIVPGKTRMDEAFRRLTEVYGNLPGYYISRNSLRILLEAPTLKWNVVVLPDGWHQDTIVQLIHFNFQGIMMGELIPFCDKPTHISVWPTQGSGVVALVCNNYRVGIGIIGQSQVGSSNEASGLILAGPLESAKYWVESSSGVRWHGFSSYPLMDLWAKFSVMND
jgi:hypothetical protein